MITPHIIHGLIITIRIEMAIGWYCQLRKNAVFPFTSQHHGRGPLGSPTHGHSKRSHTRGWIRLGSKNAAFATVKEKQPWAIVKNSSFYQHELGIWCGFATRLRGFPGDLLDLLGKWLLNVDSIGHSEMILSSLPAVVFDMGCNMMVNDATRCKRYRTYMEVSKNGGYP